MMTGNAEAQKTKSKESERLNASLINSLRILDYLGQAEQPATLAELRKTLDLNKSRVMRLCGTLEHMGYLKHENGLYALGPRLMSLGKVYERQNPTREVIRTILRDLVDRLEETASFHVLRREKRLCMCAVESPHPVRFIMLEGVEKTYPYGSIWKVIMTWGPAELREKILFEAPFRSVTPNTVVTAEALKSTIEQTRRDGYCYTNGDMDVGSAAIAAPVMDDAQHLLGVLCISGISERMDARFLERTVPLLREKSKLVSAILSA